ncbi:hypothetical protein ABVT39_023037 [Epinephelus coioides]
MTVNSSFSSNDSLPDCKFTRPASFFFITHYITRILLLLPLCILVLYLGLQRWQRQRSTSTAAAMTHSDSFTYHMVTMELVDLLGSIFNLCGVFLYRSDMLLWGEYFWSFTWHGELCFHILTCVEHYLAVIHPVTYLSLRGERGIRIRNITIGYSDRGVHRRGRSETNTDMTVNSSFSSNDSLHDCRFARPASFLFITYYITRILLLLPLCILVLYLGLQRRQRQRSTSTATMMTHSDSFTYHMVTMELVGLLGNIFGLCGVVLYRFDILSLGKYFSIFTWHGETFFHILTCVERYLAVIHPITYLSLRGERGIRIRNISIGCVWLICVGVAICITLKYFIHVAFCLLILSLIIVSFCSLSVLCVLIRPGPGEQGGDRERVDQLKRRAFYTILAILGVLLLRSSGNLAWDFVHMLGQDMTVNSSFSSSDTLHDCRFARPASFLFITYYITRILLLLPLCILVLYLGLQGRQRQRSTSTAAAMTHSDSFTYHMVTMELVGLLGCIFGLCGVVLYRFDILSLGKYFWIFTWHGETFFHILTCVERYLAVVHPITYLSLRGERGIRIRNISIGLSVLCVLIRPGPGEQGGDRERVDQSKRRAFYTILAILGVLLLRSSANLAWAVVHMLRENMTVNSSFSSSDSLHDCHFTRPASFFFITHYITRFLLLLPLCILVLYLGLQRWQQQRSTSTAAAMMTHSDSFTYHMVTMELVDLLGSIFNLCGVFLYRSDILLWGEYFWSFTWHGELCFHILTCVERYLAVIHPVTYLSLGGARDQNQKYQHWVCVAVLCWTDNLYNFKILHTCGFLLLDFVLDHRVLLQPFCSLRSDSSRARGTGWRQGKS